MWLWFLACGPSEPAAPPSVVSSFEAALSPELRAAEAACPGGRNPTVAPLDPAVLAAVFPSSVADYQQVADPGATAERLVSVRYASGDRQLQGFIADRIADCTGDAGTGAAMLGPLGRGEGMSREATTLGGAPAVLYKNADAWALEAWFGDRCQVVVGGGTGVTRDEVVAFGAALQVAGLAACNAR
jgi:hypothetical protein